MAYTVKNFTALHGSPGLSDTLLKNHFTLYEGYVNNTNKLLNLLGKKAWDATNPEYAEMKRHFGWEFDGMRLHEYYFENLGGKTAIDKEGKLGKKLTEKFGSYEAWEEDFKATGKMRGVGWVILYEDNFTGDLCNAWIGEHDAGHLAGCRLLLVMDVWEHAFTLDYGLKRPDYIEAFFKNINWEVVQNRMQ